MDIPERLTDFTTAPGEKTFTVSEIIDFWICVDVLFALKQEKEQNTISMKLYNELYTKIKAGYVVEAVEKLVNIKTNNPDDVKQNAEKYLINVVLEHLKVEYDERNDFTEEKFNEMCGIARSGNIKEALKQYYTFVVECGD